MQMTDGASPTAVSAVLIEPVGCARLYPAHLIGYFHIDIAEVRTEQNKLRMLVAMDRTSEFAFVELHERISRRTAADFLRRLIEAVPYTVHTVLTDNGTHFTTPGNFRCWSALKSDIVPQRRLHDPARLFHRRHA